MKNKKFNPLETRFRFQRRSQTKWKSNDTNCKTLHDIRWFFFGGQRNRPRNIGRAWIVQSTLHLKWWKATDKVQVPQRGKKTKNKAKVTTTILTSPCDCSVLEKLGEFMNRRARLPRKKLDFNEYKVQEFYVGNF